MAEKIKTLRCVSCGAPLKYGDTVCPYCGCSLIGVPGKQKSKEPVDDYDANSGRATLIWRGRKYDIEVESFETDTSEMVETTSLNDMTRRFCIPVFPKFTLKGYLL